MRVLSEHKQAESISAAYASNFDELIAAISSNRRVRPHILT